MKFCIYANGNYWGMWRAKTAAEAIQAAANDVGTDGNTDGLKALDAVSVDLQSEVSE